MTAQSTADTPQLKARLMVVTPKIAERMIVRNTHNRPLYERRIQQFAADIRRGDWEVNGEAIKVAEDGTILDGQHRLLAVLEADREITTLVITGLSSDTQETMDQGKPRSFSDALKLRREQNYCVLAAATRTVCVYERDGVPVASGRRTASIKELSRTLERNPELRASCQFAVALRRPWLSPSVIAGMHYLFSIASPEDAADFFHRLVTGENLTAVSPIYVLRERLLKEHHDVGGLHLRTKLAFLVRAWNAYRQGEPLMRLVWTGGGANPDRFPSIDGLAEPAEKAA